MFVIHTYSIRGGVEGPYGKICGGVGRHVSSYFVYWSRNGVHNTQPQCMRTIFNHITKNRGGLDKSMCDLNWAMRSQDFQKHTLMANALKEFNAQCPSASHFPSRSIGHRHSSVGSLVHRKSLRRPRGSIGCQRSCAGLGPTSPFS